MHPFGRGQEKFFWALVSAVSVFFIGCGINIYHGVARARVERSRSSRSRRWCSACSLFALALESFTFVVALREIGGWKGLRENRTNTTVLAVVLEDAVALLGIVLTLVVAAVSYACGPHPVFDATVAITVGVLLGAMALFLAALNRKLLIDTSDPNIDALVIDFLESRGVCADVNSVVIDDGHAVVLVRVRADGTSTHASAGSVDMRALGEELKRKRADGGTVIDEVYWRYA